MTCGANCTLHGECMHGRCVCHGLRYGAECEKDAVTDVGSEPLVAVSVSIVVVNALLLLLILFVLQRRCRRIELRWRFNEPVYATMLLLPGAVMRIVGYGHSPVTMGTWIAGPLRVAIFSLPFLLIAAAYVIVMLFFLKTGMGRLRDEAGRRTAQHIRTGLLSALAILAVTAICTRTLYLVGLSGHAMRLVHNVALAAFVLVVAAGFMHFGRALLRRVESPRYRARVWWFMISSGLLAGAAVAALILAEVLREDEKPGVWVATQAVLRLCEAGLAAVLAATMRPPPRRHQRSTDTVRFAVSGKRALTDLGKSNTATSLLDFANEDTGNDERMLL